MNRIRTAIFGGSFNPIHKGHTALARQIINEQLADEVWLMVSPQNPLKKDSNLMDEEFRLKLAQLAVKNDKNIKVSNFEFKLSRPSYTWKTLLELTQSYPDREFSLVIGADNWNLFNKWAHHNDILLGYPIIIYPRKGYPVNKEMLPDTVHFMDAPIYPYSSTEIRNAYNTLTEMLDSGVLEAFINQPYPSKHVCEY